MNTELMEALTILEKEKNISRDVMMDAIENSLISACKNHFGTAENIKVIMDRETCDYAVYAEKKVVEDGTGISEETAAVLCGSYFCLAAAEETAVSSAETAAEIMAAATAAA